VAQQTLAAVGRADSWLTVAFVRDRAIRDLNRRYRSKDKATDVLSFPGADKHEPAIEYDSPGLSSYLGDIVISTDRAVSQAEEAGHSFEREVDELVLHGALHLCGYDHEADRGEMNRLELRLRRKLLSDKG
jgi:probable rRNA maturation factor